MKIKQTSFYLICILVLSACNTANFNKQKYTDLKPLKRDIESVTTNELLSFQNETTFVPSTDDSEDFIIPTKESEILVSNNTSKDQSNDDCGDELTFKSGAFIKVKVLQVNANDIVYRPCDDLEGPAFTILKSDVAQLRYKDGSLEDLSKTEQSKPVEKPEVEEPKKNTLSDKEKPVEPFAIASLILALTGFLWLFAIILGIISLVRQKNHPDQYRKLSKTLAILGITLPLAIGLLAFIIILLLIFFW